jgi:hypothetical protein
MHIAQMKHIVGFTQSHWILSSGECSRHIAPAAAMVIIISGVKKHNTQLGFS